MPRYLLLLCIVLAACSKRERQPASSSEPVTAGAPPPQAPAPEPAEPTGSGRQQAAQQGVLGSTTTDHSGAFAPLGKGEGAAAVPKNTARPSLVFGNAVVKGELDKLVVRRYLTRIKDKLRDCYANDSLASAGKLTATFTIDGDGHVSRATANGITQTVADCVAGVIKTIEFPKPAKGAPVEVEAPMTFASP